VIGVVLGSAVNSLVTLLLAWTAPQRAIQYFAWTSTNDLAVLVPLLALGLAVGQGSAKPLNAWLLGESYAGTMGVWVGTAVLASSSLIAGTVTAYCGPIAFLGITVPHLARRLLATADHRILLPGPALAGTLVALACSIVTQFPGTDLLLPINVVTSLVGAPVVITVLLRARPSIAEVA